MVQACLSRVRSAWVRAAWTERASNLYHHCTQHTLPRPVSLARLITKRLHQTPTNSLHDKVSWSYMKELENGSSFWSLRPLWWMYIVRGKYLMILWSHHRMIDRLTQWGYRQVRRDRPKTRRSPSRAWYHITSKLQKCHSWSTSLTILK